MTQFRARRRRSLVSAVVGIVLGFALIASGTNTATGAESQTGTTSITASATSKSVTLKGWATFSGKAIASGTSKKNNAGPTGAGGGDSDLTYAAIIYRPELADFYIRWQVQKLTSVSMGIANSVGDPSIVYALKTSFAGVPVVIRAQSRGVTATFELYKCETEGVCVLARTLDGVFGTTGEEVVVTIPLATLAAIDLPVREGDKMKTPIAYTAPASIAPQNLAPNLYYDQIRMSKKAYVYVPKKSVRVYVGSHGKTAYLSKGHFKVTFPRSYFKYSKTKVKTRTCLGSCTTQYFYVKV